MGDAKITQTTVGVLREGDPDAKITQTTVGVLRTGDPDAKITQLTVGVLRRNPDILNATVKKVHWLFEVDKNNDGTVDYYWSKKDYTWLGHSYTFKITSFSPVTLVKGNPEINNLPASKMTIQITNPDNTLLPSDFEGGGVTVRLVLSATVDGVEQYWEIRTLGFTIQTATNVDQKMSFQCQDWLTAYLEGEYPNEPLVSSEFPATGMKDDNICIPIVFGTANFPIRRIYPALDATYVDVDTFTVAGDQTELFSAGQFLHAWCGVDGRKDCYVLSSAFGAVTTVNLTAGSDNLTSNLATVAVDQYLMGKSTPTYTVTEARVPHEKGFQSTYSSGDYTFKQATIAGQNGNYRTVQLIADDSNLYWDDGSTVYDAPFKISRNDLSAKTNPADIIAYLLEEFGVPSSRIDTDSVAAAAAVFTARSFALNMALWYTMPRKKLISKLLTMSGMIPVVGQKVGLKVLTKSPLATLTESLVKPGSFQINKAFTSKQKDSGYVTWQDAGEPLDEVNKTLVGVKGDEIVGVAVNPADTVIECEWADGIIKAAKAGKLALQKSLLRDRTLSFSAWSTLLFLYPGDMITIGEDNYGAEGSSYDAMITKMTINEGLLVNIECDGFSDDLDDWNDLTMTEVSIPDNNTDKGYSSVYQGPGDTINETGSARTNEITKTVLIGTNGELKTSDDPATDGGFIATKQYLRCYNDNGDLRFEAVYDGSADDGDVTIGDFAGGSGVKWDQSASELIVKVDSSGGVTVAGGGDITLAGSDSDPGKLKFEGSSYSVEVGGDASGDKYTIVPTTNNAIDFEIGNNTWWHGLSNPKFFKTIISYSYDTTTLSAGPEPIGSTTDVAGIILEPGASGTGYVSLIVQKQAVGLLDSKYKFEYDKISLSPQAHGTLRIFTHQSDSIADDDTVNLFDATAGWVDVSCNGEAGRWVVQSDGTVTKVCGTANTAATDSDTDLCVYQSGTQAIVKNRLGAVGEIRIIYFYN